MTDAHIYGFAPDNSPYENSIALQKALNENKQVMITTPGIYDISEQIIIGSNTEIVFGKDVVLRRNKSKSAKNGYVFVNRGTFSGEYDHNIKISGLHLLCNNTESTGFGKDSAIIGVRAHLVFLWVKDLHIDNFVCENLIEKDYAVQISGFENISITNSYIFGLKDGIHLGNGTNFIIKNCKFRTYDDPIALNAYDYSVSNPHVGNIDNGVIENCYDLADDHTVGFFCRILGGAWVDWYKGMKVQHSDTVVYNSRVYRVVMNPRDGKIYESVTPPCHSHGLKDYDGINWVMCTEGNVYNCGCHNIHFKDIHLQKKRNMAAIGIEYNNDTYARSYYPRAEAIPQSDITLENIHIYEDNVPILLRSTSPASNIRIINSKIPSTLLYLKNINADGLKYPKTDVYIKNCTVTSENCCPVNAEIGHEAEITISGSNSVQLCKNNCRGSVTITSSDNDN